MPGNSISIDLAQARQLVDLISAAVAELESQSALASARNADTDGAHKGDAQDQARKPLLMLASAAGQLVALAKPPNVYVAELATGSTLTVAVRIVVEASVPEIIRALTGSRTVTTRSGDSSDPRGVDNGTTITREHDDCGASVKDIAALCGVESTRLSRILRLLATHYIFRECPPPPSAPHEDRFANTETSLAFDSGAPLEDILTPAGVQHWERLQSRAPASASVANFDSTAVNDTAREAEDEESLCQRWERKFGRANKGAAFAGLMSLLTCETHENQMGLRDALLSPLRHSRTAAMQSLLERPMDDPLRAPFNFVRARESVAQGGSEDTVNMTMYQWQTLPQNKHLLHRFGCAMKAMGDFTPDDAILRGFNWSALPAGSTVLDVGGGVGSASLPILRANTHLKLIVQDTEAYIAVAPKYWKTHYPEALSRGLVAFQTHDFFTPQPALPEPPSAILMRMIMHNWPDAECATILRRARAIAGPATRLVIVDSVLTRACTESADGCGRTHGEAPQPLLANWGTASALSYKLDMIMLCNHNACERTLDAFQKLFAECGWKLETLHSASESWMPQIVAVPV